MQDREKNLVIALILAIAIGVVGLSMSAAGASAFEDRAWMWFLLWAVVAVTMGIALFAALRALFAPPSGRSGGDETDLSTENGFRRSVVQEAEAHYRSLIDAVPHGISKVDISGQIVWCNLANAKMYGYSREELIGKYVWEVLASETDREAIRSDWPRIVAEQPTPTTFHGNAHTRHGREIEIQVDWSYERDAGGALTGLICVVTDVTEQARAHARLLESEERYRLLVEASPYCIKEIDMDGYLLSMNRAGIEMFRLPGETVLAETPHLELVCEDDRERVRDSFESAKRGSPQELEFCAGDGRFIYTNLVPVRDGGDKVARIMAISMDITETKMAREDLKRSEARFKEIVQEMPVMMDAYDAEGRVVLWNRECERVTGYTAEDVIENPEVMNHLYPADDERTRAPREWSARGTDYRDWEWELRCKNGLTKIVSWSDVSNRFPIPGWSSWEVGVDVTERCRAERALADSERTLRSIAESSPDILLVVEKSGTIRFINRTIERTKEEVIGRPIFEFLEEPFRSRFRACFAGVLETRRLDSIDAEMRLAGGQVLFFEARVAPILEGDNVSAFVVAASDVTRRREAEARFRAQYEHSPIPIFTWKREDEDFVLVSTNEASFAATDGNVAEVLGRAASELYRDDPEFLEMIAECYRTKAPLTKQLRHRFLTAKEERDVEATLAFVPPDVVMVHAYDITERKAAQDALERSEVSLARAQRIAHVGNWDWLLQSNEVLWSDETYRIFGLKPHEFHPSYEAFLEMVHEDDRVRVLEAVEAALAGLAPYAIDFRILRADGEERIAHAHGEVTVGESGTPIRMVGTIQDVTEQRVAERQLASALEEKETLLREVHHRVKNNLQIVSSLLELQAQRCHDEAITTMLAEMESKVQTMALIHENLYQSADLVRVDFQSYLRNLASGLLSAHQGLPVSIETDVQKASLTIETAVPCGLIVNELVTNAVRHAFREKAGTVTIGFTKSQDDCTLWIEDDGLGLPEGIDVKQSASLGLRLVSSLTEQIYGSLDVERRHGTKFTIRFTA